MNEASTAADKRIDRRIVLKAGVALATVGPVILRGGHAEAQPRATALFAYVGALTTPERKGHGGGIIAVPALRCEERGPDRKSEIVARSGAASKYGL